MTRGSAIGFYFPLDKDERNALRAHLNALFGALGYAEEGSKPPYRGGLPAGLMALDKGELALVLLPDEQRVWVRDWLEEQAEALEEATPQSLQDLDVIEALHVIADALTAAMERED
jgi:hypothetical protein